MDQVECVVVGGGVVGLTAARALSQHAEVFVLEQGVTAGQGVSARNSGVIHAGIYYPKDWLKTQLCLAGRRLLYQYLQAKQLPHKKLGKLIVANQSQQPALRRLAQQAQHNGVEGLQLLDSTQLRNREPQLHADSALFSPESGIVDVPALLLALQAELAQAGCQLLYNQQLSSLSPEPGGGFCLTVNAGCDDAYQVFAQRVVLATGLDPLPDGLQQLKPLVPRFWAKGHYFRYQAAAPFGHLIYPMPEPQGLGVHSTLDMAGQLRFGPDVQYVPVVAKPDYAFEADAHARFVAAIKRYYPALAADKLVPDFVGIRPKLSGPDAPAEDFAVLTQRQHGLAGLVCLAGIESPGLTASFALAQLIAETLYADQF
ncbi:MAG: FAD-dependent oxidoreductase [Pseudomonadales bacterium]|nr:FAD-dependent oxidoreductase [Pseudomonadales bacterium]